MKRAILYTLLGMCILSGCRNEDFEPTDVMPCRNELTLSVCASDFVSADGMDTHTRASDDGKVTDFENGDRVGVIILNETGEIMANNLPYKFDGAMWNFDAGNGEGKSAVYYDPLMYSYIVYYPYHSTANDCQSIDELKALAVFKVQSDQSNEDAYRNSDLMVWQHDGGALENINAVLTHVRSSFSLAPVVKWQFANGLGSSYAASSLEDVVICDKDGKHISPYEAEDGSYRYTLPADYDGNIRWFYTYREKTFGGMSKVTGRESNIRYSQVETMDMGEYSLDMAQVGDFYCAYEKDGIKYGYVLPQDGVSVLSDHQCIGIVLKAGRDTKGSWTDDGTYTLKNGSTSMSKVYGYVLALRNANDGKSCKWGSRGINVNCDKNKTTGFNGYNSTQTIIKYNKEKQSGQELQEAFPAAYYATIGYEAQYPAPDNTSGWFLPSGGQCQYWLNNRDVILRSIQNAGGDEWKDRYWSSSERSYSSEIIVHYLYMNRGKMDDEYKDRSNAVRSCLAF